MTDLTRYLENIKIGERLGFKGKPAKEPSCNIYDCDDDPRAFLVWSLDDDCGVRMVIFDGSEAFERAKEYADWKFKEVNDRRGHRPIYTLHSGRPTVIKGGKP